MTVYRRGGRGCGGDKKLGNVPDEQKIECEKKKRTVKIKER